MVKNPPANAGDTDLVPGLGRSHMLGATKPNEPQIPKPALPKPVLHKKPWISATGESPCTATKTQGSQK